MPESIATTAGQRADEPPYGGTEKSATVPVAPAAEAAGAPRWLELGALGVALAVSTVGSLGLLLAGIGRYETWLALLLGLPVAAALTFGISRSLPAGGTSRAAHAGAGAAVVLALGYLIIAGAMPSQNVVLSRDPGSYVTTARWLSRDGSLGVDARGEAFEGVRGLQFTSAAVYDMGKPYPPSSVEGAPGEIRQSGQLEFQFNHLASTVMAAGYDIGGHRLLFRVPALMSALSLLLLYAVTVRITARPFVSLLAPVLLAASLPFLYVARNTYSESFTSVLLWAAVLVLAGLHRRPRVAAGVAGGVLLGALVCARIDALLYVGMAFPLAAVSIGLAPPGGERRARARTWVAVFGAAAVVGGIGWIDLNDHSGFYARDLTDEISLLREAVLAAAGVSLLGLLAWLLVPRLRTVVRGLGRPVAPVAAGLIASVVLFGWLVRPSVQTATQPLKLPTVETLQRMHGQTIDPDRSYAEDTLRWMAWYLGAPALAAAIGAMAWATWRAVRGRAEPALLGVLVLVLGAGGLYWWDPKITPDQLWATRRFVPATFPALAVMAAVAVAALASTARVDRLLRRPRAAAGALVLATAVLVVPPLATTHPLWRMRIQPGYLQPIEETCDALPADAAVIVLGGFGQATLPQSVRSWCGVPVAGQGSSLSSPADAHGVATQLAANGYRLYLLSPDRNGLTAFEEAGGHRPTSTVGVDQRYMAEQTLDRAPSRYLDPAAALAVPTPFALHLLRIDPS
ncbi:MAG: hypothetical protein JWM47_1315 [Acidimicrobiales bacterium]|nr:hypothetical protein [Acidimicrobiales bacterium]